MEQQPLLQSLNFLLEEAHKSLVQAPKALHYLKTRCVSERQIQAHLLGFNSSDGSLKAKVPADIGPWFETVEPDSLIFPLISPFFGYTGLLFRKIDERKYGHFSLPDYAKYPRFFASRANLESIFLQRSVFLSEGPFDQMALELAFPNVVSTVTASVSQAQLLYLVPMVDVWVNVFDQDKEGESGWVKFQAGLPQGKEAYRLKLPFKDPSKALEQKGEKAFIAMIQELGSNLILVGGR